MKAYKVESKLSYNAASWEKGAWILLTEIQRNDLEADYPGHLSSKSREPLTFILPDAFNNSPGDLIAPGKLAYRFQYPFSYNGKIWEDESWVGLTEAEHAEITSIYPGYLKLSGKDPITFGLPNPENQAVGGSGGGGSMTATEIQTTLNNAGISTFTDAEKTDALDGMTSSEIQTVLSADSLNLLTDTQLAEALNEPTAAQIQSTLNASSLNVLTDGEKTSALAATTAAQIKALLLADGTDLDNLSSGVIVLTPSGPTFEVPTADLVAGEVYEIYAESGDVTVTTEGAELIAGGANVVVAGGEGVKLIRNNAGDGWLAFPIGGAGGGSNMVPVAGFTWEAAGLTVTVTDTSTDPDGAIASRTFDFGGGNTATNPISQFTFAGDGTYPITINSVDLQGGSSTYTESVTVTSTPVVNLPTFTTPPNLTWGFNSKSYSNLADGSTIPAIIDLEGTLNMPLVNTTYSNVGYGSVVADGTASGAVDHHTISPDLDRVHRPNTLAEPRDGTLYMQCTVNFSTNMSGLDHLLGTATGSAESGFRLVPQVGSTFRAYVWGGNEFTGNTGTATLPGGTWDTFVLAYHPDIGKRFYKNGVLVGNPVAYGLTGTPGDSTDDLQLFGVGATAIEGEVRDLFIGNLDSLEAAAMDTTATEYHNFALVENWLA